ncbi:MAG: glycoside hydrolase family 65 protein [Anaerolineae bacterium]|nr:glycoside hydrolase family 65 protein [Anaerolineae bacterium]
MRNWIVTETPFRPTQLNHLETVFTIGNGYLGVRGAFEEGYPGEQPLVLIHGLFNQPEGAEVSELAGVPAWTGLELAFDGARFRLDQGELLGYERTLDLRSGLLRRAVLWRIPGQTVLRLVFERFASLARPHILALRVQATALDGDMMIEAAGGLGDADRSHWTDIEVGRGAPQQAFLQARAAQSGYRLGMAAHFDAGPDIRPEAGSRPTFKFMARRGQTVTLTKFIAIHTSRDAARPLDAARAALGTAVDLGYDALYRESAEAWEATWHASDVEIEGDDFAQLAIRFALYHLLIAAPRDDERVSIGAKTLSGRGYKGHVFWDTELFALAPLTFTQPALARNLLMYRYHLLPGARTKAVNNGFEGAMYPWESTDTGEETTPKWGAPLPPDGRRERIWTGDREIHISADIAYAMRQYWQVSGDDDFMARYGAEVILDTAVFWGSRVEYNAAQDRYEISHVIGPDEYHEDVNNSVFTNVMARRHLQTALEILAWLERHAPAQAGALRDRLALTPARLEHWRDVIAKMYIPRDGDLLVEFDGFFDLEPVDVAAYWPRTRSLQHIYGVPATNRTQIIKQADVVMLMALLGDAFGPPEMQRANWDVYAPRCDHGSSLSAAIHGLVAARLGMSDQAYALWRQAAGVDLEDNKGNAADGAHAAAAGGLWQAIVLGFAGLRQAGDGISLTPNLPPHWRRLRFRVMHRGRLRDVTITPDGVTIA